MKKQYYIFPVLVVIIIVAFNSCTVKKRLYQPGYYVDWHNINKKYKPNSENESSERQESVYEEKGIADNSAGKIKYCNDSEVIPEFEPAYVSNDENINSIEITNYIETQKNTINSDKKEILPETFEYNIKDKAVVTSSLAGGANKFYWASIVGFALTIIAVISIFIISFGSILISVLSVVFCAIALGKIKKYPEKYRGKWLAISGLIIGGIQLLISILLMILILIFIFG